ncbi:ubiquitin carboxyl-terminal hydrolase isozyme L3 [Atractiella rhizophila]|nr:ubiquitin carboxyl-terminal hydrolase isozyme L3 [Atractiella rhizophila]
MKTLKWIPLESNPEVMNQWASTLGMDVEAVCFQDIFGLDEELLSFLPTPVHAVVLLFPISEKYEEARRAENEILKKEDERRKEEGVKDPGQELIYVKQLINNACGTMGLLHAILNSPGVRDVHIKDGPLMDLYYSFLGKTAQERGEILNNAEEIASAHHASASAGQTRAPSADEDVDLHFVAFVEWEGQLWELDGRKNYPVCHGSVDEGRLVFKAADVVREKFIGLTDSLQFNLIGLARNAGL